MTALVPLPHGACKCFLTASRFWLPLLMSPCLGPARSNSGSWLVLILRLSLSLSCPLVTGPRTTHLGTATQVDRLHSRSRCHTEWRSLADWPRGWLQQPQVGLEMEAPGGCIWTVETSLDALVMARREPVAVPKGSTPILEELHTHLGFVAFGKNPTSSTHHCKESSRCLGRWKHPDKHPTLSCLLEHRGPRRTLFLPMDSANTSAKMQQNLERCTEACAKASTSGAGRGLPRETARRLPSTTYAVGTAAGLVLPRRRLVGE